MGWQQVASGDLGDLMQLQQYEDEVAEGQRALLRLDTNITPPADFVAGIENMLRQKGVPDCSVTTEPKALLVSFRKDFPWLAVVAAVVIGIIILAVVVSSWQLFKEVKEAVPAPVLSIGIIAALIIVGVVIFSVALRR